MAVQDRAISCSTLASLLFCKGSFAETRMCDLYAKPRPPPIFYSRDAFRRTKQNRTNAKMDGFFRLGAINSVRYTKMIRSSKVGLVVHTIARIISYNVEEVRYILGTRRDLMRI